MSYGLETRVRRVLRCTRCLIQRSFRVAPLENLGLDFRQTGTLFHCALQIDRYHIQAKCSSLVVVGQLRQGMIVFAILCLRTRNGLNGLRGGDRGSIGYHPESHTLSLPNHAGVERWD